MVVKIKSVHSIKVHQKLIGIVRYLCQLGETVQLEIRKL